MTTRDLAGLILVCLLTCVVGGLLFGAAAGLVAVWLVKWHFD